jgi:hypothetical protein
VVRHARGARCPAPTHREINRDTKGRRLCMQPNMTEMVVTSGRLITTVQ